MRLCYIYIYIPLPEASSYALNFKKPKNIIFGDCFITTWVAFNGYSLEISFTYRWTSIKMMTQFLSAFTFVFALVPKERISAILFAIISIKPWKTRLRRFATENNVLKTPNH